MRAEAWAQGTIPGLRLGVRESFLLPAEAAQAPSWAGWEDWRWKKPLGNGKESQQPGRVDGDIGDPLSSSHQTSLYVSSGSCLSSACLVSLSTVLAASPFPGYSLEDNESISMDLSH